MIMSILLSRERVFLFGWMKKKAQSGAFLQA
jgi:hypothetical protein